MTADLGDKLRERSAHLVVQGVGYVGLPLSLAFLRAGYRVTGLDCDGDKVKRLARGQSDCPDVSSESLRPFLEQGRFAVTDQDSVLREADVVVVCVPTPLSKSKEPDLSAVVAAVASIARQRRGELLVVVESTTYPGATRELVVRPLTEGARESEAVHVAFSPERYDPGNREFGVENTPKLISAATAQALELTTELYGRVVNRLIRVSSLEVAETAKLLENTFRAVNVGLVNEFAMMARKLGLDPFEVVRAASTKPFGFLPFEPGPGLGGHCLPVDPHYLSYSLRRLRYEPRFIALADQINRAMPEYVVGRLVEILNESGQALRDARVLVYGVAYKAGSNDVRESPALDLLALLRERGAAVSYLDPHVPRLEGLELASLEAATLFEPFDAVVIATAHAELPVERLGREARLVLDTRGAMPASAFLGQATERWARVETL